MKKTSTMWIPGSVKIVCPVSDYGQTCLRPQATNNRRSTSISTVTSYNRFSITTFPNIINIVFFILLFSVHISSSDLKNNNSSSLSPACFWKAEVWAACFSSSGCGDGKRTRTVICSDENGLKVDNSLCAGLSKPKTSEPCFKVCQAYLKYVSWKVGDWGNCVPSRNNKALCRDRLYGIKNRTVECIFQKGDHRKVLDLRQCENHVKPHNRVSCKSPCPQNCIFTKFSDWMPCDGRCGVLKNRTRIRRVLVAPKHSGKSCPELIEMTHCNEAQAACLQSPLSKTEKKLRIGPWTECQSSNLDSVSTEKYSQKPIIGYQTRNIECRNSYGTTVELGSCAGKVNDLPTKRTCLVSSNCQMSTWSEWSIIRPGCATTNKQLIQAEIKVRVRVTLKLPEGNGKRCPNSKETRRIDNPTLLPNCNKYKWISSEWSDCIVIIQKGHEDLDRRKANCSGGLRQRNVTCVQTADLQPVENYLCIEQRLQTMKKCNVSCKQDCVVSEWSSWGPCRPPKSSVSKAFTVQDTGYKLRSRTVLTKASAGGLECPALQEVEICDHPSWYQFHSGDWGPCKLLNTRLNCGAGQRKRTVECLTLGGKKTADRLCKFFLPSPGVVEPCYIPCAGDCVLSEWSNWSPCSRLCSDDGGSTGLRFRNRTILSFPSSGKNMCPSKEYLTKEEVCNNHNCQGIHWQTMPWHQCKSINRTVSCINGRQRRPVFCFKDGRYHVSDKKCAPVPKPADTRLCTNYCPKDCVVTPFSDWSHCPQDCPKDLSILPRRERWRFVIQWPKHGGSPCPAHMNETQECSMLHCFKRKISYEWKLGNWSVCRASQCSESYRTRASACIRRTESLTEQVEPHYCLSNSKHIPVMHEKCFATCDKPKHCYLSSWSQWSECKIDCGGKIRRTRKLLQGSVKHNHCRSYKLVEESKHDCPFSLQASFPKNDWSSCIIEKEHQVATSNGLSVTGRCGIGNQYKKGNEINTDTCEQTGIKTDMCVTSCPFDCKMESWSDWSPCNVSCGVGYTTRRRVFISDGNFGGRLCPTLIWENKARAYEEQTDVCVRTCSQFKWQTSGWTQCDTGSNKNNGLCGMGLQTQTVRCVKIAEASLPQTVPNHFCDPIMEPESQRRCDIPCPDKCVVGEWSSWTGCGQPCDKSNKRQRRRKVLRPAKLSYANSISCPVLSESEPCVWGKNCFTYKWKITKWSSCILPKEAVCGQGTVRRGLSCKRNDDRPVHHSYCLKAGLSHPSRLQTWCFVDCPIDCEVSKWTEWNEEECQKCGPEAGYMKRTRHILLMNSPSGQKCPPDLVQRKPCPFKPCFYIEKTPWSACSLKENHCGYGTRKRDVTCRRSDGHVVDIINCLWVNITESITGIFDSQWIMTVKNYQSEEDCFIPCPGDCVLSEWSPWSHCHRDCENGEEVGIQTKSRAILAYPKNNGEECPKTLYATKSCVGGPCVTFNWKVISDVIVCSSSDNVLVIGGCENKPLPCVPECIVEHSICTALGRCACQVGYKPSYQYKYSELSSKTKLTQHNIDARKLISCQPLFLTNLTGVGNMSTDDSDISVNYYPDENEFSFWMYGMIAIGTAFIIFVSVTVYLICHTRIREHLENFQSRFRRRDPPPTTDNSPKGGDIRWQEYNSAGPVRHHQQNYFTREKLEVD